MHIEVVKVATLWTHVFLSSEPCQAFLVNKNSERIDTINQTINAQIKFKTVNQVRLVEVALCNVLITLF